MRPQRLTADELADGLIGISAWTRLDDTIVRAIEFSTFPIVIEAVNRIAVEAERLDHHPDLDIRYRTLNLTLTTHDVAGLTHLDLDLAQVIDTITRELGGN